MLGCEVDSYGPCPVAGSGECGHEYQVGNRVTLFISLAAVRFSGRKTVLHVDSSIFGGHQSRFAHCGQPVSTEPRDAKLQRARLKYMRYHICGSLCGSGIEGTLPNVSHGS